MTSSSARVRWIVLRLFPLHSSQFSKQRRRVLIGVLITYIYRCRCRVLVDNNLNLFTTAQTAPFSQKNRLAFRESELIYSYLQVQMQTTAQTAPYSQKNRLAFREVSSASQLGGMFTRDDRLRHTGITLQEHPIKGYSGKHLSCGAFLAQPEVRTGVRRHPRPHVTLVSTERVDVDLSIPRHANLLHQLQEVDTCLMGMCVARSAVEYYGYMGHLREKSPEVVLLLPMLLPGPMGMVIQAEFSSGHALWMAQ